MKERAALEVFIARELYGLSLDDWKHLTGTFTFGSGATKEELDEIIRQSLALWSKQPWPSILHLKRHRICVPHSPAEQSHCGRQPDSVPGSSGG